MRYKKILSFILVVVVVASLWFISKYKDVYQEEVIFNIAFNNIPKSIVLHEDSKEINQPVVIKASGFTLIWEKMLGRNLELDFSKNTYLRNDSLFFKSSNSLKNIKEIKSGAYEVVDIEDQEVLLNFEKYIVKKVPIESQIEIEYNNNYYPISKPFFQTDSVTITGNDSKIKKLEKLEVKTNSKLIVNDSLKTISINLKDIDPELDYDPQELLLTVQATQVTEGKLDVTLRLVNNVNDYEVKIIPDTVQLIFSSPVSDFENVDINDFDVFIDYKKVDDLNISVIPEIKISNNSVISYRISPPQVQVLTVK